MEMRSGLRLAGWAGLACFGGVLIAAASIVPDPQTLAELEEFLGRRSAAPAPDSPRLRPALPNVIDAELSRLATVDFLATAAIPDNDPVEERLLPTADSGDWTADLRQSLEDRPDSLAPAIKRPARLEPEAQIETAALSKELDEYRVSKAVKRGSAPASFHGILAGANVSPNAAKGMSLPQALALAYNDNLEINAARAELRALGETVPQAQAPMRPFVSATVKTGSAFSGASLNDSLSRADTLGLGLEVSQKLFDGFQGFNNVSAARAQVAAARKNLANQEQNVLYSAATVFMDALRDRQIAALRRQNMGFLDEQIRAAEGRFELGEATRTDVAQAKSQRALASALLSSALADLEASEALFERITGAAPKELRLASVPKALLPASLKEAQSIAQREHPSILANRYTADAAAALARSAQGALLPSVNLTASINDTFALNTPAAALPAVASPSREKAEASVGVRLTIPLYQGGGASSRVRQAREVMGQRRIEADGARLKVRAAVATAWAQLQAAKANVSGFQARVTAAQLALDGVIEEQSVGQRTTLDVLNANDQVISGKILILGAQRNLVVASYGLISAVGRLSAERTGDSSRRAAAPRRPAKDDWISMRAAKAGLIRRPREAARNR
jgi:outer membrane protein